MAISKIRSATSVQGDEVLNKTLASLHQYETELVITPTEKKIFEVVLNALFQAQKTAGTTWSIHKTAKNSRSLVIKLEGGIHKILHLPLNLRILSENGAINHVILITKKVVGKGHFTNARLCYDLVNNRPYVKKNILNETEYSIIFYLKEHPLQGIVSIFSVWCRVPNYRFLEPLYPDTLANFFNIDARKNEKIKCSLIRDLLSGLANLHSIDLINHHGRVFHDDLHPGNILVRASTNLAGWEAVIIDFNHACCKFAGGGNLAFRFPEEASIKRLGNSLETADQRKFFLKYGQKMDVWSMGIILACILKAEFIKKEAPLPSLTTFWQRRSVLADFELALSKSGLDQEIKSDIDELSKTYSFENSDKIWNLMKKMLQPNPDKEGITAAEALAEFNTICPDNS